MGWTQEQFEELCKKAGVKPEEAFKTGKIELDPRIKAEHREHRSVSVTKKLGFIKKVSKASYEDRIRRGIQTPLSKHGTPSALVEKTWVDASSHEGPDDRIRVCITVKRRRPIDPDNSTAGLKNFIDCLVTSGLLPKGDSWEAIKLETRQEKVSSPSFEKTVVSIEYPD